MTDSCILVFKDLEKRSIKSLDCRVVYATTLEERRASCSNRLLSEYAFNRVYYRKYWEVSFVRWLELYIVHGARYVFISSCECRVRYLLKVWAHYHGFV